MLLTRILLLVCILSIRTHSAETTTLPEALLGCWQCDDIFVRIQAERILVKGKETNTQVLRIVEFSNETLKLIHSERDIVWHPQIKDGQLILGEKDLDWILSKRPPASGVFRKLSSIPEGLELKPIDLGKPVELSAERIEKIRLELTKRFEAEQKPRSELDGEFEKLDAAGKSADDEERINKRIREILKEMDAVDADNIGFLKPLIREIGWIDVARFGEDASHNACFLVQHSGDLPLMMAVLPEIKKDRGNAKIKGIYSLMYYRFQLFLGASKEELLRIAKEYDIRIKE